MSRWEIYTVKDGLESAFVQEHPGDLAPKLLAACANKYRCVSLLELKDLPASPLPSWLIEEEHRSDPALLVVLRFFVGARAFVITHLICPFPLLDRCNAWILCLPVCCLVLE
jgi:hypothetical protein